MKSLSVVLVCSLAAGSPASALPAARAPEVARPTPLSAAAQTLGKELRAAHPGQETRIERGIRQAAAFWRPEDGDAKAFAAFVKANFAPEGPRLDALFEHLERSFEAIDGRMAALSMDLRRQTDLDIGPILPVDEALAAFAPAAENPSAHLNEDLFKHKIAFTVLLNFPLTTLQERLSDGAKWSRRQWAEARLASRFSRRVPADVEKAVAAATSEAEVYIADYNVWMHHLVDASGKRLFAPKLRLLSHWNLRDEIKADYSEGAAGLPKQRMIQAVLERIVDQSIPAGVVDNPALDWNPFTNETRPSAVQDGPAKPVVPGREPDTRYAKLLNIFQAERRLDPYSPTAPTLIARRFDEDREIPEPRLKAMLEDVLSSPLVPKVAKLIEARLGRPLEPFDVWYNGFRERGAYTEPQLDAIVAKRYPTAEAYKKDMPRLLSQLGFSARRARELSENIAVEPARGSGHAMGAYMRSEKARLRTRVESGGMNYKGFNIAVHENGHNVEQTFSLNYVDHTLLHGVPNTAFTEALAFVFQGHDLELLGLAKPTAKSAALKTLNDFWGTYEIAGVALVDMGVWHWMYAHPKATPAELRTAAVAISKDVWNKHYAPVFGRKDVTLLGVYSHMIHSVLYLPDYPVGHMIAFQVEEKMGDMKKIGPEFERMATYGCVAPDLWMIHATGAPVGPEALLKATERALGQL
ncbi:MAG TPA: hypothetical protein VNI01_10705 [Elusimicrobiota bacterium]|nr:hypothetical protein [Elusimicrobiota bacterium]